MEISWLDEQRLVTVLVSDACKPFADDPVGLSGTMLLTPHLRLIDVADRNVEIETAE